MAKTKCVICKLFNTKNEIAKHCNPTTLAQFHFLFKSLVDKNDLNHSKAISDICIEHRNPLQFNTVVIEIGRIYAKILTLKDGHAGISTEVQIRNICGAKI